MDRYFLVFGGVLDFFFLCVCVCVCVYGGILFIFSIYGGILCWKSYFCISYKMHSRSNNHGSTSFMRDNS